MKYPKIILSFLLWGSFACAGSIELDVLNAIIKKDTQEILALLKEHGEIIDPMNEIEYSNDPHARKKALPFYNGQLSRAMSISLIIYVHIA